MDTTVDPETFRFLKELIYRHSGIHLTEKEAGVLQTRVSRRVRELELASPRAYAELLRGPLARDEIPELIDAVTINYTFFFREKAQFQALAATVLPALDAARQDDPARPLQVWSAGCSSGEEPYSIAISLAEVLGEGGLAGARVLATDINRRVLRIGTRGVYPIERFVHVPYEYRYKYLVLDGDTPAGCLRLSPELRQMVVFRRFNILRNAPPLHNNLDLIFCRNVMIYFDEPTKERLISRFRQYLRPGGYLFIGENEKLSGTGWGLEPCGPSIFRRTA